MKWLNFYRLKKLILSIIDTKCEINNFQVYLKSTGSTSYTSCWKELSSNLLKTYEIRFQRYNEEDTGVVHNGFEETMLELRKYKKNFILVHTFYDDETKYTIFTDTKFRKVIGLIQHIDKE